MTEKQYQLTASELEALRKDASVSNAIQELANILSGRSQDLPHRFRAPAAFAQYLNDYGVNQVQMMQLYATSPQAPMTLEICMRPTQKIMELVFQGADGMRLFTLEIEYAVQEKG